MRLFFTILLSMLGPGPPPPPPHPPNFESRVADLKRRWAEQPAVNVSAQRALQYSRHYLARAENAYLLANRFAADRIAEAAEDLFRVALHQRELRTGGGPVVPPPERIQDHLQRVYFETQQADYFLQQSRDPDAAPLPAWSRGFYQLALRAVDRNDWVAADQNAKCAEDIVKALEHLAQSANVGPAAPPPHPAHP